MSKKYYWLKLKENFFKQREIKKLRRIAGGDTYTIIYLKMQLLAMKNEGWMYFEETEDNILQQLELELDEDIENIQMTIQFLKHNNLIEINENQDCFLPQTAESVGKEGDSAERVRRYREKQKALQCNKKALQNNNDVTNSNTEIEIEKEKEINIKKDNGEKSPTATLINSFFEDVWKLYPIKKGKGSVSKTQKTKLYKIGIEELTRAIERYSKEITDITYMKHGSTFFNSGYIDYLDCNYQKPVTLEQIGNKQEQKKYKQFTL